jgi:hypothetical protein
LGKVGKCHQRAEFIVLHCRAAVTLTGLERVVGIFFIREGHIASQWDGS